jgi:hypothetical protein
LTAARRNSPSFASIREQVFPTVHAIKSYRNPFGLVSLVAKLAIAGTLQSDAGNPRQNPPPKKRAALGIEGGSRIQSDSGMSNGRIVDALNVRKREAGLRSVNSAGGIGTASGRQDRKTEMMDVSQTMALEEELAPSLLDDLR